MELPNYTTNATNLISFVKFCQEKSKESSEGGIYWKQSMGSFSQLGNVATMEITGFGLTLMSFEEVQMYDPLNDIQGKWEISNMDDAHFYRMGTWVEKPRMGFLGRILKMGGRLFSWLGQRPVSGNQSPVQTISKRTPSGF